MFKSALLKRWLCLLLAITLATVVLPSGGSWARAEEEQEEPGINPPPPDDDGEPTNAAYRGVVPGDVEDQAVLSTDVVSPILARVTVAEHPITQDWQVWQLDDYFIVAKKTDVSGQSETLKLLSVVSACQVTRPEKAGESLAPHVLVIQSLQPQVSATWSVGWPAELK
jgi:hypothetical protein